MFWETTFLPNKASILNQNVLRKYDVLTAHPSKDNKQTENAAIK